MLRAFLLVFCLIAYSPSAYALKQTNQCKKQEWQLLQQLHQLQKCQQDSDCGTQHFACPFGCAVPLNITHPDLPATKQNIQNHLKNCQHCKQGCTAPSKKLVCLAGLCTYNIPNTPTFPQDPRHLQDLINVTPIIHTNKKGRTTYRWQLKDGISIRYEHHPDPKHPDHNNPNHSAYYPRHHGFHYHVTQTPLNKKHKTKVKPSGYLLGSGTGFLAGESMPRLLAPYLAIAIDK